MSNQDQHWPRWIKSSIAKHFKANRQSIHLYVEGFERDTKDKREWFELRVDGPFTTELDKGTFRLDVEINVLVCLTTDTSNAYRMEDLTGIVNRAFILHIPIYKLGPSSDAANDGTLLGYLTQRKGDKERAVVSNFGKVRVDTMMEQSSVEMHYRMYLDT